jgi:quercetin dioxygenase-like cupin family protein
MPPLSRRSAACAHALLLLTALPVFAQQEGVPAIPPAPTISGAPDVVPAPGRGMKPGISTHRAATPDLFKLDAQPSETLSPLISRQVLHGSQSTFVKWTMKKGAVVPVHSHPNEQVTWFLTGAAEVYSQGQKYTMRAGDIMIIPPNVPHEFHFLEDTIDIDIFAPQRQDWIDGTANYIPQAPK